MPEACMTPVRPRAVTTCHEQKLTQIWHSTDNERLINRCSPNAKYFGAEQVWRLVWLGGSFGISFARNAGTEGLMVVLGAVRVGPRQGRCPKEVQPNNLFAYGWLLHDHKRRRHRRHTLQC